MCCARCHIGHKYGGEHSGSDVFGIHEYGPEVTRMRRRRRDVRHSALCLRCKEFNLFTLFNLALLFKLYLSFRESYDLILI